MRTLGQWLYASLVASWRVFRVFESIQNSRTVAVCQSCGKLKIIQNLSIQNFRTVAVCQSCNKLEMSLRAFRTAGQWMYASPVVGFSFLYFLIEFLGQWLYASPPGALCKGLKIEIFASLIKILTTRLNSPGIISD